MVSLEDNKLISLKDAAKISGYTADYIGQLIRAGKIPGKQVYANIQWMTTEEAVMDYKNKGQLKTGEGISDKFSNQKRKLFMQLNILGLFFKTFKSALPLLLIIIVGFILLCTYIIQLLTMTPDGKVPESAMPVSGQELKF